MISQVTPNVDEATAIDVNLENLFSQKTPRKYKIAGVTISGNKYFDTALLVSVANINIGDEVIIPGGDQFARAINNLWKQNYFSDVEIFVTRLEGLNIYIDIEVTERPRLASFNFKGVSKTESEDLTKKVGLVRGRIVTENNRRSAVEAIKKYFSDKGFRGVQTTINEVKDTKIENSLIVNFVMTSKNTGLNLVMALSYSSRWELVNAAKNIAIDAKLGKLNPEDITHEILEQYLCTKNIPDPELMIRTSGDFRISNFLLYQLAYTELYFTETRWPDFRKENLYKAILDYQGRERRFGKISEQVNADNDNGA